MVSKAVLDVRFQTEAHTLLVTDNNIALLHINRISLLVLRSSAAEWHSTQKQSLLFLFLSPEDELHSE